MKDLGDSGDYPRLSRWVQYNHIGPDKRKGGRIMNIHLRRKEVTYRENLVLNGSVLEPL